MELRESEEQLNLEELKILEDNLGKTLPQSFIDFYLKNNGGIPSHRHIDGKRIAFFQPLKYGKIDRTIEATIENLNLAKRLPQGFLPFAHDSGGWDFCIDLNENNYGVIYMLPNGTGDLMPIFVAPNFNKLIENLALEDDY